MGLLEELSSLLTNAPGNLIYHLALAFSIAGAFQVAFGQWRSTQFPQVRRTLLGLAVLLLAQLVAFAINALAWQSVLDPAAILPPLDRAITLFSLIWVAWLWLFPEPNRLADASNALLNFLILTGLGLSFASWMPHVAAQAYNLTLQDSVWQFFALGFIALTGISLFIRRPNGWNHGVAFMTLVFLGHGLHLLLGYGPGDFPGIVRIFYLAAYPILLTLPQRFPGPLTPISASHRAPTRVQKPDSPIRERRRYSTDPKTFHALLSLASEIEINKINHSVTRAIAQTMFADLCFLIYLVEDTKEMVLASGYDLIREENLEGSSLNKAVVPMLANAIQRGKPLRLPQSSTSPDMQGLGELLGLANAGHLLSAPILNEKKEPIGGVLLLSPYSNRLWNADDQAFLSNISSSLITILERGKNLEKIKDQSKRSQKVADEYRVQIDSLRTEKNSLQKRLDEIETEIANTVDHSKNVEDLIALQEEAQQEIQRQRNENEKLREELLSRRDTVSENAPSAEISYLENELKASLKEVARLQNLVAQANLRILELESGPPKGDPNEQAAVVASISQELRQPMSSIIGYTDLLLGESVGILGALQRKFVERIKSSIERIGNLTDDIIQVTTLELGLAELKPEPIDLNMVIDNAMAYTSNQAREKNISINLDLPKELAPIHADKDALQQILIHLLQNAGAASPIDGSVSLSVRTKDENGQAFILIQVADTGGGIPPEDLSRVFSRLYRAENVLIQGVGDTGVGLSIAKTLTEAQQGRIWVDSEKNVGSTFSVLLPIAHSHVDEK